MPMALQAAETVDLVGLGESKRSPATKTNEALVSFTRVAMRARQAVRSCWRRICFEESLTEA